MQKPSTKSEWAHSVTVGVRKLRVILEKPKYKDWKPNHEMYFFKLWNIGEPTGKREKESSAMVRSAKIRGYLYDIILLLTTYDGKPFVFSFFLYSSK